ncbi:hypothetical protein IEO21_05773 [Rhodonia placenta]|uniref:Uncharacterized protein n=1 Tax=Rhodonia placenta TaxID=104341 RepID=A0A8H7P1E4_9APHY|nr:hypothetical protein IEO21_05773 [Postia placenta]
MDALAHIFAIALVHSDTIEPVFPYIKRDSPLGDIPRLRKHKQCPGAETAEVPAKREEASDVLRVVQRFCMLGRHFSTYALS